MVKKLGEPCISIFVDQKISMAELDKNTYISTENMLPKYGGVTAITKLPKSGSFTRYKRADILVSNIRPYLKKVWMANRDGGASSDIIVIRAGTKVTSSFLAVQIASDDFISRMMRDAQGVKMPRGNLSSIKQYLIRVTTKEEQEKIADFLSSVDELIQAQEQKLHYLRDYKKGLVQQLFPQEGEALPRLRFPEFRDAGKWNQVAFSDLIDPVTPPKKLRSSTYLPDGRFPVIDQSQNYICGWTNDDESVITAPLPAIVFGDHTCVLKFVDQPFAQGADGIKVFTAKRCVSTPYLYHQLSHKPLVMEQYKRHFSMLKNKFIYFPNRKSGEQQKISDCLSSLDELISAQEQKIHALRDYKKGLVQQLFPVQEV